VHDRLLHDNWPLRVQGYANIFGVEASTESGVEVFRPGAFAGHLECGAQNVIATWGHFADYAWASVKDGTLKLWEDGIGLCFEATVESSPFGAGLVRFIAEGNAASSILFDSLHQVETANGREVKKAFLRDICVCIEGAYPTAVWLRGNAQPDTLTPYARELRATWLANRAARDAERLERLTRTAHSTSAPRSRHREVSRSTPRVTEAEAFGPPPGNLSMDAWLGFARSCGHAAREAGRRNRRST